jgi:hypothetical protein
MILNITAYGIYSPPFETLLSNYEGFSFPKIRTYSKFSL